MFTTKMTVTAMAQWFAIACWILHQMTTAVVAASDCDVADAIADCEPCLYRGKYNVRAIYHGQNFDPFWLQVEAAAEQASKDVGINLKVTLYDEFNPSKMEQDVLSVIDSYKNLDSNFPTDALIVSMPTKEIEEAVKKVIAAGIPVFGVNSGYSSFQEVGVLAYIGQNDYQAGVAAAEKFIEILDPSSIQKAIFINHEELNTGVQARFQGFSETLKRLANVDVEELIIDGSLNDQVLVEDIRPIFTGCLYDVVQLANARTVDLALAGFDGLFADCTGRSLIGTFDVSRSAYDGITLSKIAFGVSQQPYLQGALPVLLATQYLSLGMLPVAPRGVKTDDDLGLYQVGPRVVGRDEVPSDTIQLCTDDAFPVCPRQDKLDGTGVSDCSCFERETIGIGMVVQQGEGSSTSEDVLHGARQAASDFGIDLNLETASTIDDLAKAIEGLCNNNMDGVVIQIPASLQYIADDNPVVQAVKWCRLLAVPVIAINQIGGAGIVDPIDAVADLDLATYMGVDPIAAGKIAGAKMLEAGVVSVYCLVEPGIIPEDDSTTTTSSQAQQCQGLEEAINENSFVPYRGMVTVTDLASVEELVSVSHSNWRGVGLYSPVSSTVSKSHSDVLVGLKTNNPESIVGTFGNLNNDLLDFGLDDQAYWQGYMAVPLLSYQTYTRLAIMNPMLDMGPRLQSMPAEDESSSIEAQNIEGLLVCQENNFEVCAADDARVSDVLAERCYLAREDDKGNKGLVIGLSVGGGVLLCCCILYIIGKNSMSDDDDDFSGHGKKEEKAPYE